MVLVVVLCVVVIGGSLFFIIKSWPGDEDERVWEGGAPPVGVGPGAGPGAKAGGNAGATPIQPIGGGPQVGQPAPEIAAEDVDGVQFKLSDYRGKVVMLDFWGNW
jgi:hypothetical protein